MGGGRRLGTLIGFAGLVATVIGVYIAYQAWKHPVAPGGSPPPGASAPPSETSSPPTPEPRTSGPVVEPTPGRVPAPAAGGEIRYRPGSSPGSAPAYCLDVVNSQEDDGTPVQTHNCNDTEAQTWTLGADGSVRAFGKCLTVGGRTRQLSTAGGRSLGQVPLVVLATCADPLSGAQRWERHPQNDGGERLYNAGTGSCLTNTAEPAWEDDVLVQMVTARCGWPGQSWDPSG